MFQEMQFRAPVVIFGMNTIQHVGAETKKLGAGRVLVVTGPRVKEAGILEKTLSSIKEASIEADVNIQDRDTPEPSTDIAEETAEIAKQGKFDVIIGLGGGSILDVAKMASALVTNPGKTREYFGKEKVTRRGIPTIMIPTTSGTGAEITKHAIFHDPEVNVKKAVASSNLLPNVALIDPMLTLSCPPRVTASAGLDAWLHAAEPYVSKNANHITDTLAMKAIPLISQWVGPAFADGNNLEARYSMSLGSMMSGMVLNNSGTSLVHALSYPVGGEFHTPHGVTLSALLAACFEYIIVAKQEKMANLAAAMGENTDGLSQREAALLVPDAIREMLKSIGLPSNLRELDVNDKSRFPTWAKEAHKEQRLLGRCPRVLSVEDIETIYDMAF